MRVVVCLYLCLVAGCGFQHGVSGGTRDDGSPGGDDDAAIGTGDDAARDAFIPDAPAPLCGASTPRINAMFETAPACPLDNTGGSATLTLAQGTLQISTNTNGQNAFCNEQNLAAWSGNGATIEVPSTMTGNNAWTSFQVLGPNFAMTVKNNMMLFSDNGGGTIYVSIAYNSANMLWWRMRPDATNANVIAEYSADRVHWTMLGSHSGTGIATIRLQMIAGTDGSASPMGNSRYDNLVACP